MAQNCTAIIDIGKTHAKLTLWDEHGGLVAQLSRANEHATAVIGKFHCRVLDIAGLHSWLMQSLAALSQRGTIRFLVPVCHGAAAVLLRHNAEYLPPLDYEEIVSRGERLPYSKQRDSFSATGSPELPNGLNLGIQLHRIEQLTGELPDDVSILLWPQYWAWRLCGVMSSEVSSLGCHTDLWRPVEGRYSDLAVNRGWAKLMPPLTPAGQRLGTLLPDIAKATGVPEQCEVLCGLHDSNAALLAARGHPEIADDEATVLSTGTWFVAMRSPSNKTHLNAIDLDASRDCLVNVDVCGRAIPSARFMGGRELEIMASLGNFDIRTEYSQDVLMRCLPELIAGRVFACPAFVAGVGPFPDSIGDFERQPQDPVAQRAVASLYLALVANVALDLIGSRQRLLVDGRYASDQVFVRALAALRPHQEVLVANGEHDVAYGALRLVNPKLPPQYAVKRVAPLNIDLAGYRAEWLARSNDLPNQAGAGA